MVRDAGPCLVTNQFRAQPMSLLSRSYVSNTQFIVRISKAAAPCLLYTTKIDV
jgi:hypothetical protein